MNHAEELIAQLRIIGRLEDFGSGARFARRFQGAGAEERIHWHLRRRCFVRRLKSEVLPQLPAKRQVVVPVALDNEREYRRAEEDIVAWLREQPLELSELEAKVAATLRAERLAQLNTLKRLAARGKLGAALGWIHDFLASDEPLVVFCGNREVQEPLLERFPDALHLLGRDSIEQREAAVQRVPGARRAAAAGLRDARRRPGHHAHARLERRVPRPRVDAGDARPGRGPLHRIGQHDAVTAWYLLAAETIDETMIELIAASAGSSARSPTAAATSPRRSCSRWCASCAPRRGGGCASHSLRLGPGGDLAQRGGVTWRRRSRTCGAVGNAAWRPPGPAARRVAVGQGRPVHDRVRDLRSPRAETVGIGGPRPVGARADGCQFPDCSGTWRRRRGRGSSRARTRDAARERGSSTAGRPATTSRTGGSAVAAGPVRAAIVAVAASGDGRDLRS